MVRMKIDIRLAKPGELDPIIKLVRPMWITHGIKESKILDKGYLKNLDARKYFSPCFTNQRKMRLYVAVDEKVVVGCLRAEVIDLRGIFNEKNAIYIDDLAVKENYRGKGIGKMLIEKVENFARSKKIKLLKNRVYEFNSGAKKLFENQGFRSIYSEQYKILENSK